MESVYYNQPTKQPTNKQPLQWLCAHGEHMHSCVHVGRTCNHYPATPEVVKKPIGHLLFCKISINLFCREPHAGFSQETQLVDNYEISACCFFSLFCFNALTSTYPAHHQTSVESFSYCVPADFISEAG